MNRFDRINAMLTNEPLDRWVYSLWKHFPGIDRTPKGFASAHINFQRHYDSDLLKLSPHGAYCRIDWGCEVGATHPVHGYPQAISFPISTPLDFEALEELDPLDGEFGKQVDGVKRVVKKLLDQVPMMMTIFSPFMVASELDPHLLDHLSTDPTSVEAGLKIITQVMIEFSHAILDLGVTGLFIASQHSGHGILSDQYFKRFEAKYTQKLQAAVRKKAEFMVFHIHGKNPRFQYVAKNYPIDAINWHSQTTPPSLEDALSLSDKVLLGGIDGSQLMRHGTPDTIRKQLGEVMALSDRRLILAPGCVLPIDTPPENIRTVVEMIRKTPAPNH